MLEMPALAMLEAAYNLSEDKAATLRAIARAATEITPRGPVAVCTYDVANALPDLHASHFERAHDRWVAALMALSRALPIALRRSALSLAPTAVDSRSGHITKHLTGALGALARELSLVAVMANTGDGGGLSVGFGEQAAGPWPAARLRQLQAIAPHLAAAWRLRAALAVAKPAVVAELRVDGAPAELTAAAATPTAREALRQAVLARERVRTGQGSGEVLWPALVAGRWSLVDAFTAAGTRYIVAYENPAGAASLRALTPRERAVLEHLLAGRSGKWIALELALSEPTVTRAAHAALRRLGVADVVALSGARTARFESLEGVHSGRALAVSYQTSDARALENLSHAERGIIAEMLNGKSLPAIAKARGTSRRTVAHQFSSIYQKLGVSSRRELLAQLSQGRMKEQPMA